MIQGDKKYDMQIHLLLVANTGLNLTLFGWVKPTQLRNTCKAPVFSTNIVNYEHFNLASELHPSYPEVKMYTAHRGCPSTSVSLHSCLCIRDCVAQGTMQSILSSGSMAC